MFLKKLLFCDEQPLILNKTSEVLTMPHPRHEDWVCLGKSLAIRQSSHDKLLIVRFAICAKNYNEGQNSQGQLLKTYPKSKYIVIGHFTNSKLYKELPFTLPSNNFCKINSSLGLRKVYNALKILQCLGSCVRWVWWGGGGGEGEGFEFSHIALVVPKLLTLVVNLIN